MSAWKCFVTAPGQSATRPVSRAWYRQRGSNAAANVGSCRDSAIELKPQGDLGVGPDTLSARNFSSSSGPPGASP